MIGSERYPIARKTWKRARKRLGQSGASTKMTAYKITVVELSDMSELSIVCGNCSTRTTWPVSAPVPEQCPSCHLVLDESLRNAMAAFARFRRDAGNTNTRVELLVKENIQSSS